MTTGTTPTASAAIFTVTFTTPRGNVTYPVLSQNLAKYTALAQVPFTSGAASNTGYAVSSGATALTAATVYTFNVSCP